MQSDLQLSFSTILELPHFKNAEIIAGKKGLNRTIKWVHILDSQLFDSLSGNELILSTGRVLTGLEESMSFLRNLIEKNVSGLCVELVSHITCIPNEMIKLADEYDFPLIVFNETKNFINITRELHTMIINNDKVAISQMDNFTEIVNKVLLSPHDIEDILITVYQFLGREIAYIPINGEPIFVPHLTPIEQKKFLNLIKEYQPNSSNVFMAGKSVTVLERKWADVYILSNIELKQIELLILDKVAMTIAQDVLRELYMKEHRRHEENQWIINWLYGRLTEYEIVQNLNKEKTPSSVSGYIVCELKFWSNAHHAKFLNKFMTHTMIFARSIFEDEGFFLLGTYQEDKIIFVLFDRSIDANWKKRIRRVIEQLQLRNNQLPKEIAGTFGVGKKVKHIMGVIESFQTAQDAINIQGRISRNEPLYDSWHIYRIISLVEKVSKLDDFITEYLAPVIQYDKEHHTELMKTLQVYFNSNGSKQKTAESLFIVRQTLYLRIEKLEHLLGEDFMDAEKRLAIEFALCAYNYIKSGQTDLMI